MKKVTAVLMSILLSFGLAACGSTQDGSKQEATDRTVESVETESSSQPEMEIPIPQRGKHWLSTFPCRKPVITIT